MIGYSRQRVEFEPGVKVLGLILRPLDGQPPVGDGAFHLQSPEHQENVVSGVAAKDGVGGFRARRSRLEAVAVDQ